jgi:tRNA pseudouridine38-40 synthase
MRTLLLTLRFLGTNYHGWQVQENAKSIMEEVQDAVEALFGTRDPVTGCSRTDTGVHAEMFCCTLRTENPISCYRLIAGMNAKLPEDIAVSDCIEVPDDFHPRYDATAKQYRYRIWNDKARNPFWEGRAHYVHPPLDAERMNENAKDFLGTHDFTSFTNSKEVINDNVRTVRRAEVFREGECIVFLVEADGFLYNMVRIMAGTLLAMETGQRESGSIPAILEARDRNAAGKTAPACGLYLHRVFYEDREDIEWNV